MRFTVIPQSTFDDIQLDAGVLLKNFNPATPTAPADSDIICATTGGISPSCVPSYSDYGEDIDNCPMNVKELKHLDGWECKLGFTSLGTSAEHIRLASPSIGVATGRFNIGQHGRCVFVSKTVIRAHGVCQISKIGYGSHIPVLAIPHA